MKFLKRLILLVLVLVAALVGIGYVLPDSAHVERDVPEVGTGSTLIVQSNPPKRVVNRLELPDLSNATYYFEIDETDDGSRVTWGFDTEFRGNLIGRYFGLMMDRWIGAEYERGLENLKQLVEQQSGKQDDQQGGG